MTRIWRRSWSLNMHTPNEHESKDKASSVREGYEVTDVSVSGITVFLIGLFISVGVFFVFCFGMGKVINNALIKRDGPPNKWNASTSQAEKFQNMQSNPAGEQMKLQQLTQSFPTPRLQTDNGAQDLVDLNRREDLLLDHYSWVNQSQGKVRIPIERAMELIAQRGLPVEAKPASTEPLLFGDKVPTIRVPLTDGYARTAFEQEEDTGSKQPGEQTSSGANDN
jgi:hypothetical protein